MTRVVALLLMLQAAASAPAGSVSGVVTDATSRAPVAFAHILLARADGPLTQSIVGKTDEQGRFAIANVPPGSYRVFAEDADYLRKEHAVPISVAAGQSHAGIAMALTRTGVISGRVLTERGDPAPSIYVRAWQGTNLVAETRTNDLGEYRLYGLAPGPHVVGAQRYQGPRIGKMGPTGQPVSAEMYLVPTPPCPDCRGEGVGGMSLTALLKAGGFIDPRALSGRTYPQVFFQATTDRAAASTIEVESGAEVSGIDLRLIVQ